MSVARRIGYLLVGCMMVSAPVGATAELKVGFVDLSKVFDGYERTKVSDDSLQKRGKQKEAELEARMAELRKLRQSLELLNDDAREAKIREIEEKAEDLQRFRASTARNLRRDRDKMARQLLGEIRTGVADYAKANGFSLIVDDRSVLYGTAAHDVTDEVLKLLNSQATGKSAQKSQ
jgi:outer membrane protein